MCNNLIFSAHAADPRKDKKSERIELAGYDGGSNERKHMDTPTGLRDRHGPIKSCSSGTNIWLQRIEFCAPICPPDCACPIRKIHFGRNRQATRAQGFSPSRLCGQARYHSGLVSQADCPQVRWLPIPSLPRQARIEPKLEALIVQMAKKNSGWEYDRIVGALVNLGYTLSDETVGNVLRATGLRRRRSGAIPRPGKNLFNRIWRCWPASISSRSRSLLGVGW